MKKVLFLLLGACAFLSSANAELCVSTSSSKCSGDDLVANDYIAEWGRLKVVGKQLSSEKGAPIQLKGWSSFGNYSENCLKSDGATLRQMKAYGANAIRVACYLNDFQFSDDDVKAFIRNTASVGMYCLIDFHYLPKKDGNNFGGLANKAKDFFSMVSSFVKQNGYKHVLYELINEPGQCSWNDIKSYADQVIPSIANNDKGACIIVGTPQWDQQINSNGPSGGQPNANGCHLLYAFHLYANEGAHQRLASSEFSPACKNFPVFVSEWGLSRAEPELNGASYDDCNASFGQSFVDMMNGNNQGGQKVSWFNWSYANKAEGSSTFKNRCGGDFSPSGEFIVGVLGGASDYKVKTGAAFDMDAIPTFSASSTGDNKVLISCDKFNRNPESKDPTAGQNIGYYDGNNTPDEGYDLKTEKLAPIDEYVTVSCSGCTNENKKMLQCYAGREWCSVRADECVDLNGSQVEGKWGSTCNIGWICDGEWLNYAVKVTTPGYYRIENLGCQGNEGDAQPFVLGLVEHPSADLMMNLDKSTETEESPLDIFYAGANENVPGKVDGNANWGWAYCANADGESSKKYGILFKEAGDYNIKVSFPATENAGFSDMRFEYVKPWNGEGYPEEEFDIEDPTSSATVSAKVGIKVYPAVVKDGSINVYADGEAVVNIFNMAGALVASQAIDGAATISVDLAAGVYNVQVVSAESSVTAKIVVK